MFQKLARILISDKTNRELLELIKSDNEIAFYHIYERYCKRLYGFVLRYVKHEVDANEIVQEVFVKIWESRGKIDLYSSFDSYIFTITYNHTISLLRKRLSEKKYLEYLKSIQVENSANLMDEVQYNELKEQVTQLLNSLTPRQKEIYTLSREEGLSHAEIAKKLNISVNTVKKHMTNTLSFLKKNIDNGLLINLLFVYLFIS